MVLVAVAGAILSSFFNEEAVSSPDGALAYLTIFALVFSDAIVPVLPGETTLNTASVLASQGSLELGLVIVAGASAPCWATRPSTGSCGPGRTG